MLRRDAGDQRGDRRGQQVVGRVSGILGVFVLGFLLVTPPVFGFVYDVTGNYDAAFMGFIALAAVLLLLVPMIRMQPKAAYDVPQPEAA